MIPANNANKVLIDRVELVNGIRRVAVCSNPTTNLIRMDIANNKVNLTAPLLHQRTHLAHDIGLRAATVPTDLPVLLVAGDADPVGDYGKGVSLVHSWLEKAGVEDLILRLYPEMRHEILNELGREAVYTDLLLWLEKRCKLAQRECAGKQ